MSEQQVAQQDREEEDDFASTQGQPDTARPAATRRSQPRHAGRWVESSWELQQGLSVREGLPADAALDEWIDALLRG